jgi:hypothetical protein
MKGLKSNKKSPASVNVPETDEQKLAHLFTTKPVTVNAEMTELEKAALRDEWLDRRNIITRSIVDQTEGNIEAINFLKERLRTEYGSKFGEMPNILKDTEAGEKMSLTELEGVMKFATRLLYATEYSYQYENPKYNPETKEAHRVDLTTAELKERMAAFCGLLYKMGMGYKPIFTWGVKGDTLPKIAWDKV